MRKSEKLFLNRMKFFQTNIRQTTTKENLNTFKVSKAILNIFIDLKYEAVSLFKYGTIGARGTKIKHSEANSKILMTKSTNKLCCENKRKENIPTAPEIIRDADNTGHEVSDEDIIDNILKKMQHLKVEKMQLLDDILCNDLAGDMLVNIIKEKGTEAEVEKLLIHISQVEQVTSLLVLLTCRLARAENMRKRKDITGESILNQQEVKLLKQLEDAERLRLYRYNQGKVLHHMVSKYSKDFWPKFEHFLRIKVNQNVDLRLLGDKIQFYEEILQHLSNNFQTDKQ